MHINQLLDGILSSLVLLGLVRESSAPIFECQAQAWVRAPDLAPNTIVQGDIGVKMSAGCPVLETALLGLRFKERSFVRALRSRQDAKWMQLEHAVDTHRLLLGTFPEGYPANRSSRSAYQETLKNRHLWIDRQEERVVFEKTQALHVPEEKAGRDIVQEFSILVPSTNFPPAPNYAPSELDTDFGLEPVRAESIYEYFVRLSFLDGTTNEIPAGFTAFQPVYPPADHSHSPRSKTIEFKTRSGFLLDDSPSANYTAQISTVSGFVFTEGLEDQVVTVVITRTRPASILSAPLMIRACVDPGFIPRWAIENDLLDLVPISIPRHVLRSTPEDVDSAKQDARSIACISRDSPAVSVVMPDPTSEQPQGNDVIATSAAVTILVEVDRRLTPHFETYYQTFGSTLVITLRTTPPIEDERFDPGLSSGRGFAWALPMDDDDRGWEPSKQKGLPEMTSKMKHPEIWVGGVSVVVHPAVEATRTRCCHVHSSSSTDMSAQVMMSDDSETDCEQVPPIHYLAEGARGPVFVDGSAVQELLAKDPAERNLLAPFLDPVMSSPPEGEDLVYRYFHDEENPYKCFIYVGEIWAQTRDEFWDMFVLHTYLTTVQACWLKLPVQ